MLPKLSSGIDVNVQFKNVDSFESTQQLAVFETLHVPLYHGWLPDPQVIIFLFDIKQFFSSFIFLQGYY